MYTENITMETQRWLLRVLLQTMTSRKIHIASNNKTYLGFHMNFPKILSDINKLCYRKIIIKVSNIKFHESPSSGGRSNNMQTDGQTDILNIKMK